jgi:hypothetical protein
MRVRCDTGTWRKTEERGGGGANEIHERSLSLCHSLSWFRD